jgi:CMP-N-acetylneuraminic acid synthetase
MKIFVPIKGNSQRVPNKNFREFCGVPLHLHTINKLDEHEVYIDTDSDSLLGSYGLAKERGEYKNVTIYKRANNLLGDKVSVNDLIWYWLDNYIGEDCSDEALCQIHVTSPFLNVRTLESAKTWLNSHHDSVAGCDVISARVWREEKIDATDNIRSIPVNHNPRQLEQTQDITPVLVENSSFYMFTRRSFIKAKNRLGDNPRFQSVNFPENIDIDTEDDWELATKLSGVL